MRTQRNGSYQKISYHARQRMKERGLSFNDLDFILTNGITERIERNRIAISIPYSPFSILGGKRRERLSGASIVLADDDTIVTVQWRDSRFSSLTEELRLNFREYFDEK